MIHLEHYNNNQELIISLKKGDINAFNSIYNKYYGRLISYVTRILHSNGSAHDIVQESFIKLWENRTKFNSSPIAYLYKSAYNKAIDNCAHKKIVANYEKLHEENLYYSKVIQLPEAEALLINKEIEDLLAEALQKLPERCRLIFEMSRNEYLKNREIAEILGVTEKCVENQMTIAISRLRSDLKNVIENSYLITILFGG